MKSGADGEDGSTEDPPEDQTEQLSPDELKLAKAELRAVKKELKRLEQDFVDRLQQACAALDDEAARALVLNIPKGELQAIIDDYVAEHRELVVAAFQTWWDKYRVTLATIEHDRGEAEARLMNLLVDLRYA